MIVLPPNAKSLSKFAVPLPEAASAGTPLVDRPTVVAAVDVAEMVAVIVTV